MNISVIGAGISGLAVSALLAKSGHHLHVYEKNSSVGGRARVWKEDGFTFDMGPSWYLMPQVYEDFFSQFNKSVSDFYQLKRLDPGYRIFLKDQHVDIHADLRQNLQTFDTLEPNGAHKLTSYLKYAAQQYHFSEKSRAMLTSFDSPKDYLHPAFLLNAPKVDIRKDFYSVLCKYFDTEAARNVAAYAVIFLGADPRAMPALFSMLSHIDFTQGVWYPTGGIGSLVAGLHQLCIDQGVTFHFNSPVQSIKVLTKQAVGIQVDNSLIPTDLVISATDYHHTETQLLESEYQTYPQSFWDKRLLTPTAFVIYLGLNKRLKKFLHHNAFLHHGWQSHFDQIFTHPSWPDSPAYYVCVPSLTDSTVAASGCENVFITVPISTKLSDSPQTREKFFNTIITDLETRVGESINESIILKRIFTQTDFTNDYHASSGTALGPAPTLKQSGFFAPRHQSRKVSNLYYVGQYTHPGSGMPAVLHSAQIVSSKIQSSYA